MRIFLRGIHVETNVGVVHRYVAQVRSNRVYDIACSGGKLRTQKGFNQVAPGEVGVTVLAIMFGNDAPKILFRRREKFAVEFCERRGTYGWAIHQRDDGRVTAAIQDILQAEFEGAELAEFGGGIPNEKATQGIDDGRHLIEVCASNDDHEIAVRLEGDDVSAEESIGQARRRLR